MASGYGQAEETQDSGVIEAGRTSVGQLVPPLPQSKASFKVTSDKLARVII